MRPFFAILAAALAVTTPHQAALAWGERGHEVIDRAAIEAIPEDGPVFLKKHVDYIAASASQPDGWRGNAEGFSKIAEDPNHGWFREQFTFLRPIPRSRYEFVLALYDRHLQIKESDPETAARTNVRWTGTLPYAAMEAYDRIVVCMRQVRKLASEGRDPTFAEQTCAFDVARLGHYIGDGANPMHNSIHSDGWRGDNPDGFTTDRTVHGRFEGRFVDGIELTPDDILPRIAARPQLDGDVFDVVLAYLDESGNKVGEVYRLERRDGFADFADSDVREMVYERTAAGAAMLRDLLCRAWAESANPPKVIEPAPLDFEKSGLQPCHWIGTGCIALTGPFEGFPTISAVIRPSGTRRANYGSSNNPGREPVSGKESVAPREHVLPLRHPCLPLSAFGAPAYPPIGIPGGISGTASRWSRTLRSLSSSLRRPPT